MREVTISLSSLPLRAYSLLFVFLGILLQQIGRGILGPLSTIKVNEAISSEIRASATSLIATIGTGIYAIVAIGLNLVKAELHNSMIVNSLLYLVLVISFIGLIFVSRNANGYNKQPDEEMW